MQYYARTYHAGRYRRRRKPAMSGKLPYSCVPGQQIKPLSKHNDQPAHQPSRLLTKVRARVRVTFRVGVRDRVRDPGRGGGRREPKPYK